MRNLNKLVVALVILLSAVDGTYGQGSPGGYVFSAAISDSLSVPVRMAMDNMDNIYVTDALHKRINKYDAAGNYSGSIVTVGAPISIAINESNSLYIGDGETGKIFKLNSNGTTTELYGGTVFPSSMVFCSDGLLYVSDSRLQRVIVLDLSGNVVRTIGLGTLICPTGITFDKKNNRILVAEHGGIGTGFNPVVKVRIYGLTGNLITSFGSHGNGDGKFYRIQGLAVGRCGEIYVAEPYQGNVNVFDENTLFLTRFGQYGDSISQLRVPLDIAINSQDRIFITAENNGVINVFDIDYLLPTANITCGNKTICAGATTEIPVNFTGTAPWTFTYTVNGINPVTVTNTSNNPYILTASAPGNYQVTAISDSSLAGTCFSGNAIITIDTVIPTSSITTGNITFCPGQTAAISIDFTGTPPWTFTYEKNGTNPVTISQVISSNYLLNVTEAGNYAITALSGRGCTGSAFTGNATVTAGVAPIASITAGNSTICEGSSTNLAIGLTGMAPWSVTYTINGTNPVTLNNIIDNPYQLPVSLAGSYRVVQVQDAFCVDTVSTVSTEITVKSLPAANLSSGNAAICPGNSTNILVDLTGTAPWTFTYTIDGLNHSTVSGVTTSPYVLPVSQPGLYQLAGVSDGGCVGSDVAGAAIISENPRPAVNLGNDAIIIAGELYTLDAGASFAGYLWSDGSSGQTLQLSTAGDYEVTVSDHLGCSNSDTVHVTVTDIPANRDLEFLNIAGTACFSATQTITVAGSHSTFMVQDGGQATLIAGKNIICLPGTMVEPGGYLHGYITPDSTYCGGTTLPVAPYPSNNAPVAAFSENLILENILKIYPNPSTGIITMAINNPCSLDLQIEIIDMAGRHVYSKAIGHLNLTEQVDLGLFRSGFYLVKLTSGKMAKITKLVLID